MTTYPTTTNTTPGIHTNYITIDITPGKKETIFSAYAPIAIVSDETSNYHLYSSEIKDDSIASSICKSNKEELAEGMVFIERSEVEASKFDQENELYGSSHEDEILKVAREGFAIIDRTQAQGIKKDDLNWDACLDVVGIVPQWFRTYAKHLFTTRDTLERVKQNAHMNAYFPHIQVPENHEVNIIDDDIDFFADIPFHTAWVSNSSEDTMNRLAVRVIETNMAHSSRVLYLYKPAEYRFSESSAGIVKPFDGSLEEGFQLVSCPGEVSCEGALERLTA